MKAIFILSSKSSGSTALQNYLKKNFDFTTVLYTQHQEEESLYWSKVASILGLHQDSMYRSIVPLSPKKAVDDLNNFFKNNGLVNIQCSTNTTELEFQDYFYHLIKSTGSKFIEKSPHHLYNESNLQLILNFKKRYSQKIEVIIIGLVRHPSSVVYSAWNRWKYIPREFELEYKQSYENLIKWKEDLNIKIINYEDLVQNKISLEDYVNENKVSNTYKLKTSSLYKWSTDHKFGYIPSQDVKKLVLNFNYKSFENECSNYLKWQSTVMKFRLQYYLKSIIKKS